MTVTVDLVEGLLQGGHIDEAMARAAREHQESAGGSMASALVAVGVDAGEVFAYGLSQSGHEATANLAAEPGDPQALATMSPDQARTWKVIPLRYDADGAMVVAAGLGAYRDNQVRENLRLLYPGHRWLLARDEEITRRLNVDYRNEDSISEVIASSQGDTAVESAPRVVQLHMQQAIKDRASDVHLDPAPAGMVVRYRIDGVLAEHGTIPRALVDPIVAHVKVLASMDPSERRKPQDGRIVTDTEDGRKVELRVASSPGVLGEKIVIRILDDAGKVVDLGASGFSELTDSRWRAALESTEGLILAVGPTGSGKTTLLNASLAAINSPDINILTVEDPVEYRIPGVHQVQVIEKSGLTFDVVSESFLRMDPDVAMVGEIRSQRTAEAAVELSMTGHLVLATLHANSAPGAAPRLANMGVEQHLVSSVLKAAISQRLVRTLCHTCRVPWEPGDDELQQVGFTLPPEVPAGQMFTADANGCPRCTRGYRGRIAIHEVMPQTPGVQQAIANGHVFEDDIYAAAVADGMRPLKQDGWIKVAQGLTTVAEVLRVAS